MNAHQRRMHARRMVRTLSDDGVMWAADRWLFPPLDSVTGWRMAHRSAARTEASRRGLEWSPTLPDGWLDDIGSPAHVLAEAAVEALADVAAALADTDV